MTRVRRPFLALTLFWLLTVQAQTTITTPKEQFGFNVGDDYVLANYTQYVEYLKKLDRESDRLTVQEIGKTSEGRTMYVVIITSPENQKKLGRFREISERLAHAEGLTDSQARSLAEEGKAVVWIDGGLHATETLGSQQLIENIYQLASRTDDETLRFLNDVIVLNCLVNPDGMELVSNWYMKEREPQGRTFDGLPRLYNKYAGHDNNRDFYMSALAETEAINKVLFREWFPQIVYDHHQTGPAGAVMFSPPFRDPFNYFLDPLVTTLLDEAGAAMHSRFAMEGKPGVTSRTGGNYSTWWNGGLRTSPYFHNQIGLLTETIGSPTPISIPFIQGKALPQTDTPFPIDPQPRWHFRQSIEYSITANRAVLDYASRNKDRLLFNTYRMGMNSIERGSRDHWTMTPRRTRGVKSAQEWRPAAARDPRGYIIPAGQPDFLTATKFINTLIKNGVAVDRATSQFNVNGQSYPAGSFVVKAAQAFRPQILDMFEPQDHPDDFAYPGAAPTAPYDIAGWTLAFQMGVRFDRILESFDGPFERLKQEFRPVGAVTEMANPAGYLLSHEVNDSFMAVNQLLGSHEDVFWMANSFFANGKTYPAGTQFIPSKPTTLEKLRRMSRDIGLSFEAVASSPQGQAFALRLPRIALWDRAGGSVPSGWTRYVLEEFDFPYTVVLSDALEQANLAQRFDVLILVDDAASTPPAPLKKFVEDGGSILAMGDSTKLAYSLDLPVSDALANLTRSDFYVPGSVLQARVNNNKPLAYGMPDRADFFFINSPAFRIKDGAEAIAFYDSDEPLRSGWAWGQKSLENAAAVVEVSLGKGKVVLYGPEILFRSQPHGTYKLFFNGIYLNRLVAVTLK